jgi:hypothetical protein
VASLSLSWRSSLSGTVNSAFPQFQQTNTFGKTQTTGLSRPFSPGEWMAISAWSLPCLSDPHDLHVTVHFLSKPIITRPAESSVEMGRVGQKSKTAARMNRLQRKSKPLNQKQHRSPTLLKREELERGGSAEISTPLAERPYVVARKRL